MVLKTVFAAGVISAGLAGGAQGATLIAGPTDGVVTGHLPLFEQMRVAPEPDHLHDLLSLRAMFAAQFAYDVPLIGVPALKPLSFEGHDARRVAVAGYLTRPAQPVSMQRAPAQTKLIELPVPLSGVLLATAFGMLGLTARRRPRTRVHRRLDRSAYTRTS